MPSIFFSLSLFMCTMRIRFVYTKTHVQCKQTLRSESESNSQRSIMGKWNEWRIKLKSISRFCIGVNMRSLSDGFWSIQSRAHTSHKPFEVEAHQKLRVETNRHSNHWRRLMATNLIQLFPCITAKWKKKKSNKRKETASNWDWAHAVVSFSTKPFTRRIVQ